MHCLFFKQFKLKERNRYESSDVHEFSYFKYGSHALLLQWPKSKSLSTLHKIIQIQSQIGNAKINGIIELVPAFHSLMIYFRPSQLSNDALIRIIESLTPREYVPGKSTETVVIPVSYAEHHGPDQRAVAAHLNISREELIELHSNAVYYVHFIGFLPGFLYLGGLNDQLNLPRRDVPRIRIPAGSVAIAAGQTGIYPVDSPGGWHIIGHTDYNLFRPDESPPCPLIPGMNVQFMPI